MRRILMVLLVCTCLGGLWLASQSQQVAGKAQVEKPSYKSLNPEAVRSLILEGEKILIANAAVSSNFVFIASLQQQKDQLSVPSFSMERVRFREENGSLSNFDLHGLRIQGCMLLHDVTAHNIQVTGMMTDDNFAAVRIICARECSFARLKSSENVAVGDISSVSLNLDGCKAVEMRVTDVKATMYVRMRDITVDSLCLGRICTPSLNLCGLKCTKGMNLAGLQPGENGVGYIVCDPDMAEHIARAAPGIPLVY